MPCLVSVIVPVYNDPEGLATTLQALVRQTFPQEAYEIIVCDNGSEDDTRDVARRYQCEHPDLVHLVVEDQVQSSYAARNKGIANATGQILAFVDADMWMDEDWLSRVSSRMQDGDMDYLGCNVEIRELKDSLVGHYNAIFGFPVEHYLRVAHYAPTCCLVVRRSILEKVGLFDSSLISGGDWLFGNKVHDCGIEQHFADDITLYHPARDSLTSFVKKYFRISRGHRQLERVYPGRRQEKHLGLSSFLPVKPAAYLDVIDSHGEAARLGLLDHLAFYALFCCRKWVGGLGWLYEELLERSSVTRSAWVRSSVTGCRGREQEKE